MVTIIRNTENPWEIIEKYEGGGPKTYRHNVTGETLSQRAYKRLKDSGFQNSEAFSEPPELDASPQVELPPPPPIRDWQVQMGGKSDKGGDSSFFASIGPGLFNVVRGGAKILLNRTGREWAADYIPPAALVTPVLAPLFRIADRHSPIKVDISGSADIADVLKAVAGAEKLIDYWSETAAAHRAEEDAYYAERDGDGDDEPGYNQERPESPYVGPTDRTPTGRERSKPRTAAARAREAMAHLSTWRAASGADSRGGGSNGRSQSGNGGGDAASGGTNGVRNAKAGGAIGPERAASIISDLLAADAHGRLTTGLA